MKIENHAKRASSTSHHVRMDYFESQDGTAAVGRVQELLFVATGDNPVSDSAFQEYVEFIAASVKSEGPFRGALLWLPIYGLNAAQRKELTGKYSDAVRMDACRQVALVTDSALVRGVLNAVGWFHPMNARAFSTKDDPKGILDWLATEVDFDPVQAERMRQRLIAYVIDHS